MTVVDDAAQMFKKSGKELDIPRGFEEILDLDCAKTMPPNDL